MSEITIAIVEDEMIIANNISDNLEKMGYEVLEPCVSFSEALEMLSKETPDLVILDIQLAGNKDGIDLAWEIKRNHGIPFIFLTSNVDKGTIERAKELNPPAFLAKPFKGPELFAAIELAIHNFEKHTNEDAYKNLVGNSVFVKQKNLFHRILFEDITYLKSDYVYVEIHTRSGKKFLHRSSMLEFLKRLPQKLFIQVQRSYFVSVNYISAINSEFIVVNDHEVPLGRKYKHKLLEVIRDTQGGPPDPEQKQ